MNSKVQFRMFTIFDLDKVEDYLHEMHLKVGNLNRIVLAFSILNNADQMM